MKHFTMDVFKLILFVIVLALVAIGGIASYRWLNGKIMASNKLGGVLGHALLLIVINLAILIGGSYMLIFLYRFLFAAE